MTASDKKTPADIDRPPGSMRTGQAEAALSLLKDLNALLVKSDQGQFRFLSYLLRMAVLEARALASGADGQDDTGATPYADRS